MIYTRKSDKICSIKGQKYVPLLYNQGDCIYKDDDTCKAELNVTTYLNKYNSSTHNSDPSHHLKNHLNNSFNKLIIANESNNKWT